MHDHSKKLAFILVLSAHAAAAILVQRSLKTPHTGRAADEQPPLLVSFLTLTPPRPPPPPAVPSPGQRRREPIPIAPPEPQVTTPAPETSTAITDWRAQGAEAARNAVSAARPKPFGHEFAPSSEQPETGVFGPKNEHPAGTVEVLDGTERHWVTDYCYFDIPRHPVIEDMPGPKTMSRFCVAPGSGGTDMFKKLRPGYLTPPQTPPVKPPDKP